MPEKNRPSAEELTQSKAEQDYYEGLPESGQEEITMRTNEILKADDGGMIQVDALSQATKEHMDANIEPVDAEV